MKHNTKDFQTKSSNCFDLHLSNPHVYRVSSKACFLNPKPIFMRNWSLTFLEKVEIGSSISDCGRHLT
jgi:hypothetical protein